jgi:hypothetical protein
MGRIFAVKKVPSEAFSGEKSTINEPNPAILALAL